MSNNNEENNDKPKEGGGEGDESRQLELESQANTKRQAPQQELQQEDRPSKAAKTEDPPSAQVAEKKGSEGDPQKQEQTTSKAAAKKKPPPPPGPSKAASAASKSMKPPPAAPAKKLSLFEQDKKNRKRRLNRITAQRKRLRQRAELQNLQKAQSSLTTANQNLTTQNKALRESLSLVRNHSEGKVQPGQNNAQHAQLIHASVTQKLRQVGVLPTIPVANNHQAFGNNGFPQNNLFAAAAAAAAQQDNSGQLNRLLQTGLNNMTGNLRDQNVQNPLFAMSLFSAASQVPSSSTDSDGNSSMPVSQQQQQSSASRMRAALGHASRPQGNAFGGGQQQPYPHQFSSSFQQHQNASTSNQSHQSQNWQHQTTQQQINQLLSDLMNKQQQQSSYASAQGGQSTSSGTSFSTSQQQQTGANHQQIDPSLAALLGLSYRQQETSSAGSLAVAQNNAMGQQQAPSLSGLLSLLQGPSQSQSQYQQNSQGQHNEQSAALAAALGQSHPQWQQQPQQPQYQKSQPTQSNALLAAALGLSQHQMSGFGQQPSGSDSNQQADGLATLLGIDQQQQGNSSSRFGQPAFSLSAASIALAALSGNSSLSGAAAELRQQAVSAMMGNNSGFSQTQQASSHPPLAATASAGRQESMGRENHQSYLSGGANNEGPAPSALAQSGRDFADTQATSSNISPQLSNALLQSLLQLASPGSQQQNPENKQGPP